MKNFATALFFTTLALQACVAEAPVTGDADEVVLDLGVTHRLGGQTGLTDAHHIFLSDGRVVLPMTDLLGDLDLTRAQVDVTSTPTADHGWRVALEPGKQATQQLGRGMVCGDWEILVIYYSDGSVGWKYNCLRWVAV